MEGRWKRWLASGILLSFMGCTRSSTVSSPAPMTAVSKPIKTEAKKEGPLSPDTLVTMGNLHVAAAMEENHTASERQNLLQLGNTEFQQALQRDPKNLGAYGGLAQMYTQLGDKEKALETYRKAAEVVPDNSDVYVGMALCCKQFNDRDGAVTYLHAATKMNPKDRRLKINLGFELAMAQRYRESYAWLEKTLGETQAHYSLAQVCEHQGNKAKAQEELQLALQTNPTYQPALDLLARLSQPQPAIPADNGGGLKTVGFEEMSAIPESRLAPNAKLIASPDLRKPTDTNPPSNLKPAPAAAIQTPATPSSTDPRPLPAMSLGKGWER